ncbi:MAG TPA: NAD-dependent epimerase/dehydratase family protein [Vicinamibacterales bacterium]
MSKAVVTGAGGFIGKALTRYLAQSGWSAVGIDRVRPPDCDVSFVTADVARPGALGGLLDDKTTVFHLAASADVAKSVADPRTDFENTFRGVFEVLEAARYAKSRVVFPSTASIFDSSNVLPLPERAFPRPSSPYAAGKLGGEAYCHAYHRCYGLDVRIARLFSVYGVGMFRFAIHDIVRKIQRDNRTVIILGDGTQVRDYLFIDDAVRGLEFIATAGTAGEEYNLASGVPVTLLELTKRIATAMGCPDILIKTSGQSFAGDTPRWYADISKIRSLGFEPRVDLDSGLRQTIAWLETVPVAVTT